MPALTSRFIDSKIDMANIVRDQARRMHGDAARPLAAVRPLTPKNTQNPYAAAGIPTKAWARHAEERAGSILAHDLS